MLALYDAKDNALQREQARLGEAELYERLLSQFVQREVSKQDSDRHKRDFDDDVESELERLSVAAFAIFNRRVQWIAEPELNDDLIAMFDVEPRHRSPGMSTPLSAGEALLGRFFFVQGAEAVRDLQVLRTYEFLHATFGEYLIARLIWRILRDLLKIEIARPRRHAANPLDDGELHALLSFAPLSSRGSILGFLGDLAALSGDRIEVMELLKRIFRESDSPIDRSYADYRPRSSSPTARYAVYCLNLVLLRSAIGGAFDARDLDIDDWPRLTALWKSQLPPDEWRSLILSVSVRWISDESVIISEESTRSKLCELSELVDPESDLRHAVAESNFTADPVLNAFRYPIEDDSIENVRLKERRGVFELAAVFASRDERAATYIKWADRLPSLVVNRLGADPTVFPETLGVIAKSGAGKISGFWRQVFARIGYGEYDEELLGLCGDVKSHVQSVDTAISAFDAWLRLCESGFNFPQDRAYPNLEELVTHLSMPEIQARRPDLIRRLGYERRRVRGRKSRRQ